MASTLRKRGGCFELRYRHQEPGMEIGARLGLIIPKRLAKRAVLRNLLKRLARESFRHALPGLPRADMVLRLVKAPLMSTAGPDGLTRKLWRRDFDALFAGLM
jgi:ribonuclease P protein component